MCNTFILYIGIYMTTFTIATTGGSLEVQGSVQASQAFRALKQDDPKGSHTLKRGSEILLSHNSTEKSIYGNCNSVN